MFTPRKLKENSSTPRDNGDGDGVRKNAASTKNIPSRKLHGRTAMKINLGDSECDTTAKSLIPKKKKHALQKSMSVAEITPSRTTKKCSEESSDPSIILYATPRPLGTRPRRCVLEKHMCTIYRRLMLMAWRKTRAFATSMAETIKTRDHQLDTCQRSLEVLNELRMSEEQKRVHAMAECQKFKEANDLLETENKRLVEEIQSLSRKVEENGSDLAEATEKNAHFKEQMRKVHEKLVKIQEKVTLQEAELISQYSVIGHLNEALKAAERNLKDVESNLRFKERKYAQLKQEYKKEVEMNGAHVREIRKLQESVDELQCSCIQSREHFEDEIRYLQVELEEEKQYSRYFKIARQFASRSSSMLKKIAGRAVSIYLDTY
ncbi:uncharacterized protein LOC132705423 [Cylas formicarius]|uniref:uncharacterized protein LOC132705423 n=1 Tax=Cylas formicarius TaxID=197179 RepID=UPI002958BFBD|nr:uncharacterized protein LOC132705423 [Cylas formicarius]